MKHPIQPNSYLKRILVNTSYSILLQTYINKAFKQLHYCLINCYSYMTHKSDRLQKAHQSKLIEIKTITWNKDSHGLFDYESQNCLTQKLKFSATELFIYRNRQTSEVVAYNSDSIKQQELGQDLAFMTRIFSQKVNGVLNYFVGNTEKKLVKKDSEKTMTQESITDEIIKQDVYLNVKNLKNSYGSDQGHVLEIGQKIKLGRVQYSVIEIQINDKKEVSQSGLYSFFKNQTKLQENDIQLEEGAFCKICMQGIVEENNFLLSPCLCSGSCKYIHINCLKNWIFSKVKKETVGGTAYYHFDRFQCEICKFSLPKFISKNNVTYQLLCVDRPEGNYLILEQVGLQKKDLIVIKNIPQEGISLGRGHQCQIRIHDISVSRQHAQILLKNNKFVLFDKQSKFGTLVKLTKSLPIDNCKRSFQIGRTVISFAIKRDRLQTKQSTQMAIEAPIITQDQANIRRASK